MQSVSSLSYRNKLFANVVLLREHHPFTRLRAASHDPVLRAPSSASPARRGRRPDCRALQLHARRPAPDAGRSRRRRAIDCHGARQAPIGRPVTERQDAVPHPIHIPPTTRQLQALRERSGMQAEMGHFVPGGYPGASDKPACPHRGADTGRESGGHSAAPGL